MDKTHPIFHIEAEYRDTNGDPVLIDEKFVSPKAAFEWMQAITERIYDEEQTERRIEERGNDIMFTNQADEAHYQLKHA